MDLGAWFLEQTPLPEDARMVEEAQFRVFRVWDPGLLAAVDLQGFRVWAKRPKLELEVDLWLCR